MARPVVDFQDVRHYRAMYAKQVVDVKTELDGLTVASVEVAAPGVGLCIIPISLIAQAQLVGAGELLDSLQAAAASDLDARRIDIFRKDTGGSDVSRMTMPLQHNQGFDRKFDSFIEEDPVDIAEAYVNSTLGIEFNGKRASDEYQFICLHYKIIPAMRSVS